MTMPSRSRRTTVEIALDSRLVEAALHANLDIGAEAGKSLRRMIGPALSPVEVEEVREQMARYDLHVEEHGLFSDAWRRF